MVSGSSTKTTQLDAEITALKRKETKSVVVLVSGGPDSAAVAMKMREIGYSVHGLFIDYGQAAFDVENEVVEDYAKTLGFTSMTCVKARIPFWKIPKSAKTDEEGWIPGRNTIFMALAAIFAKSIDADGIAIGFMTDDLGVFGDNNLTHHLLIQTLMSLSLSSYMKVFLPIKHMTKGEVLDYVKDVVTVSCWFPIIKDGRIVVCGECPNCVERMKYENI